MDDNQSEPFAKSLAARRTHVYSYVLRRVGQNTALAEDMTQDCLVRVWQTREDNPPPSGALVSYLLTTVQNLLRDRYRRTTADISGDLSLAVNKETPEHAFVKRETVSRLLAEAALLPFVLRETLRLRVVEGLEYGEIAARMGCPPGTVKSRLHAAREKLRVAMDAAETLPINTTSATVITRHTVSRRGNTTITTIEKGKTMTTKANDAIGELRAAQRAMEARLNALEKREGGTVTPAADDSWSGTVSEIADNLQKYRTDKAIDFGLATAYLIAQSGKVGSTGVRYSITMHDGVPSDEDIARRTKRMHSLTAHPAILRAFRHFFALRFAGKQMRATATELAEATGESRENIAALLAPFVADRTLLFVLNGANGETYEWEGNDISVTALLFADP